MNLEKEIELLAQNCIDYLPLNNSKYFIDLMVQGFMIKHPLVRREVLLPKLQEYSLRYMKL